jgi:hypothetical protein
MQIADAVIPATLLIVFSVPDPLARLNSEE